MEVTDLLELFRLEVDDVAEPYLWSDKEFFIYLNDAQDVHTRLTGGLADRRSPLTKISYKSGDQFKKYDDRILRIKGAIDEENNKITILNLDNIESVYLDDDYGRRVNAGLDDGKTGDIQYLVTDVDANEIQFYPIPDHDGYIRVFVARRPLEEITGDGDELEIPPQHHLNLLNWVKYKAFMKQDVETFDGSKAEDFLSDFNAGLLHAERERRSREDRKRIVTYGGIPMS